MNRRGRWSLVWYHFKQAWARAIETHIDPSECLICTDPQAGHTGPCTKDMRRPA